MGRVDTRAEKLNHPLKKAAFVTVLPTGGRNSGRGRFRA
jgi:hypothetical protein